MKVEVRIHKEDLIKVVEVSDEVFTDFGDQPSNEEIRKFLLERLQDEWYDDEEKLLWIDAGGSILNEKTPDMKLSKKNGSYFIEK